MSIVVELWAFLRTRKKFWLLAVGNCFLRKEDQDPSLKRNYENAFELD